ncbi:MAG: YihY family inner membrane protein [Alysiella sp.]|uniref:YihY family inner membrane protein n=1 Tax=Alysiella sp. TaxID=1872483 RepID=UPI0026DD3335|nr:YihY family inner membrane protein [Alysiella sp.]MDO4433546.1 YihY family inner membrane protein [Alysiella sp.]
MMFSRYLRHLQHQPAFGFVLFIYKRFMEVGVPQVAGSLTFTTLLALVPLLTVMLVMITAFPVFGDVTSAFMDFVRNNIVPSGASVVADYLDEFKTAAGRLTSIGIIMMVVTSLMLVQTIDETFNRIWRVQKQCSFWVRLPAYWLLLTLGPLVLGFSISLSAYFMRLETLNQLSHFSGSLKLVGQLCFDIGVFFVLFRFVPNCHVSMKHALLGALITAIFLETAKWGFGIYIRNFNSYQLIYGAFAAIPVFLIWLQILWMIVLTGALITASLSYWRGAAFRQPERNRLRFDDAIALLLCLNTAHKQGTTVHEHTFRQHHAMGYDQLADLLNDLTDYNYIERGKKGWLLKTAPESIHLNTLFTQLVYQTGDTLPPKLHPQIQHLNISLADLYNHLNQHPHS